MKIGFTGLDLPEGSVRYNDNILSALSKKDNPKKVSPFYVEFLPDEFDKCEAIVLTKSAIMDLLIYDMEKIETRMVRLSDAEEIGILQECLDSLESDIPLCDLPLTVKEASVVMSAAPFSLKPVVQVEDDTEIDDIVSRVLDKTGFMFFYTSGPSESHAWLVKKQSDIVSCAGAIHTDLARGFIKGDVVSFEDYMNCYNFNDCRAKGLSKLTDRDYVVQPGEIIEIRFNVSS